MKTPIQKAAAAMGRVKSEKKTAAARVNGAKGGRPAQPESLKLEAAAAAWQDAAEEAATPARREKCLAKAKDLLAKADNARAKESKI